MAWKQGQISIQIAHLTLILVESDSHRFIVQRISLISSWNLIGQVLVKNYFALFVAT